MKVYDNYPANSYFEWCLTVDKRRGVMIDLKTLQDIVKNSPASTGFTTIYAFMQEDAEIIKEAKSSRGLNRFVVGAGFIPIDVDTGAEGLADVEAKLAGHNYTVYSSGSKGAHVYVRQSEFIWDANLPYSHLCWLKSIGIDADESLYQHGRLLALEGRVHHKTKRKKEFLKHVEGKPAIVEIVAPPENLFKYVGSYSDTSLEHALVAVVNLKMCEPSQGLRHTRIWSTAMSLAKNGLNKDTVIDLMISVNKSWSNPKPDNEVIASVNRAFDQASKGY